MSKTPLKAALAGAALIVGLQACSSKKDDQPIEPEPTELSTPARPAPAVKVISLEEEIRNFAKSDIKPCVNQNPRGTTIAGKSKSKWGNDLLDRLSVSGQFSAMVAEFRSRENTFEPGHVTTSCAPLFGGALANYQGGTSKTKHFPSIQVSLAQGQTAAIYSAAHEIAHSHQHRSGRLDSAILEPEAMKTFEALIKQTTLAEAQASLSAIEYAYAEFEQGRPDALLYALHESTIGGGYKYYAQRMAQTFIATLYEMEEFPQDLSISALSTMRPSSDAKRRNMARAAAFAEWFKPSELPEDTHEIEYSSHIESYFQLTQYNFNIRIREFGLVRSNDFYELWTGERETGLPAAPICPNCYYEIKAPGAAFKIIEASEINIRDYTQSIDGNFARYLPEAFKGDDFILRYMTDSSREYASKIRAAIHNYQRSGAPIITAFRNDVTTAHAGNPPEMQPIM